MKLYSHSKLSTFEQCPFKFKLRYIDEIIPEVEKTIEAHLGSSVHSTLEWLYNQVKSGSIPNIDSLVTQYGEFWKETFSDGIKIVRDNFSAKDYFEKGIRFLIDYYLKHKPFDDGTIELEKQILVNLDGNYGIRGFIDRLVYNKREGQYEIHDYKTANTLPTKEKIDSDRQLALYSLAIIQSSGIQNQIKLVWHYLSFNKTLISTRTRDQLENLRNQTLELIKRIESTSQFSPVKSVLCSWCEYKSLCPAHGGSPNERQTDLISHFEKEKDYFED